MYIGRAELSLTVGHMAPVVTGACAAEPSDSEGIIPNAHGFLKTPVSSANADESGAFKNLLCSIKVILIYIPVRSAGGGLTYYLLIARGSSPSIHSFVRATMRVL